MGWLLGCFNCTGKFEGGKPKKHLSGLHHLVVGRSNSATVAHATSPEDLRVVRKSPSFASRKEHFEKKPSNYLTSHLQDEVKARKSANHFSNQTEERVPFHNHNLDRKLENMRERLLQDVNAAKQLSDEVSNVSQSNSADCSVESKKLNCAIVDGVHESLLITQNRLHQGRVSHPPPRYFPSPPWLFSAAKSQGHSSCTDEASDDLLMEHLDVASFIEDSALITDWELSSGSSYPDLLGPNDQFLAQEKKSHSESTTDGNIFDSNFDHPSRVLESCTKEEAGSGLYSFLDETSWNSYGNDRSESFASHSAEDVSSNKDSEYLFRPEICAAAEESDSISLSQSCFSSQLRLLKCALRNATENLSDQECAKEDYMLRNYSRDDNEVLSPSIHPEMEPLQERKNWEDENHPLLRSIMKSNSLYDNDRVAYLNGSDIPVSDDSLYFNMSSLEAKVLQDNDVDLLIKGQLDVTMSEKSYIMTFRSEEDDMKQRKKSKIKDDSSPGGMCEVILAEDDMKVPLLDAPAIVDGVQSSVESRKDFFCKQERSISKHVIDENPFKPSSTALPSLLYGGPPLSVTSYRSSMKLADERPIIGTVAAHWSPITTRKWWDGKGIPNSTNKYQEDQKVNWHAIPFEVRLEQALAKQNTML